MVPGLSRGLALLKLFTRQRPAWTLAELAAGLGISRSAAYRIVYTLEKEGFIARNATTRHYRLTSAVLQLGFEYFNSQNISDVAHQYLRKASDRTSSSAYLAILDGWHAVYLSRVAPSVSLVSNLPMGSREPAHITAAGRVLLAGLTESQLREVHTSLKRECRSVPVPRRYEAFAETTAEDRARGYVYHVSKIDPQLRSCACSIRDGAGLAVAAITIVGTVRGLEELGEETMATIVTDTARDISRELGYRGG